MILSPPFLFLSASKCCSKRSHFLDLPQKEKQQTTPNKRKKKIEGKKKLMPRNNRRHHANAGEFPRFRRQSSPETTPQLQTPPPLPPSKPNPRFLPLLLQALIMTFVISLFFVFVGVAAIIFLHLCIAGGALHRRHRIHRRQSRHQPISGDEEFSSGCSLEELKDLPKSRFRGSDTCAICLDNLLEGEICRILPSCNHVFHCNCVDKWLLKVPACPVCRSSVRSSNAEGKRTAGIDWEQLWAACG